MHTVQALLRRVAWAITHAWTKGILRNTSRVPSMMTFDQRAVEIYLGRTEQRTLQVSQFCALIGCSWHRMLPTRYASLSQKDGTKTNPVTQPSCPHWNMPGAPPGSRKARSKNYRHEIVFNPELSHLPPLKIIQIFSCHQVSQIQWNEPQVDLESGFKIWFAASFIMWKHLLSRPAICNIIPVIFCQ